jgi:hypothetical protein
LGLLHIYVFGGLGPTLCYIVLWASFCLLYTLGFGLYSGSPTGNGDGDLQNVLLPASPDGDGNFPVKLPAGTKNTPIASPNGVNPRRGSGIGAPLPSLVAASTSWTSLLLQKCVDAAIIL